MMTTKRLRLASALAALGVAQAQMATETVIHSFGNFPRGANPYGTLARDSAGGLYGTTYQGGAANLGVVFKSAGSGYKVLHSFVGSADGANPYAGVTLDSAGNLYGTTYNGGVAGKGVVYKVDPSGQETVLYSFTGGADGANPYAGVSLDAAGNLYGTTYQGGAANLGVVYKVDAIGQETVLYGFLGGTDGANPYGGVILDPVGNLYGTTYGGGSAANAGVIFKVSGAGKETVLYRFLGSTQGASPHAGVVRNAQGDLFGTLEYGVGGIIYKLSPAGSFKVLHQFLGYGPRTLESGVALDAAGNLYGTTQFGGNHHAGVVYKLDTAGELQTLCSFPGAPELGLSVATGFTGAVILDATGNVYGTTPYAGLGGMIYKINTSGQAKTLYTFLPAAGGTRPFGGVIRDSSGNLYGTTSNGGTANAGVVYKVNAAGQETALYSFTDGVGTGLARDSAGNIYGTAGNSATGLGSVFKLSPDGLYTVLYNFTGGVDGTGSAGVILDPAGNLYGTSGGGTAPAGLVYKLAPSGRFTALYTFTGGADGSYPNAQLILDRAGNLYGTTVYGGVGVGVIYRLDRSGRETVLYSFTGGADGGNPSAGVTLDSADNLYGTTPNYGVWGWGVLFELEAAGSYKVLYSFSGSADGGGPTAGVVRGTSGELYGTTADGGLTGGVVYQWKLSGELTVLHTFTGSGDGNYPYAGVILNPAGGLYGTTTYGGTAGGGVVYMLR